MFKKVSRYIAVHQLLFILLPLILVILIPVATANRYILRMATLCMVNVSLALSLNLVTGYMGQMNFGHAAFWGIGSYTAALLITRLGFTTIPAMILSMAVSGFFGLLVSLPVMKLKGYYLTIVTMGFCEIVRLVEFNWTAFTGGAMGIMNIPALSVFGIKFKSYTQIFYIALIMVVLITIVVRNLVYSNYGLAIKAIRDDDDAAETMGIDIVRVKRMTFIISAALAGAIGAFYAQYITFIHPSSYTYAASQEILVMIIFGGLGSIPGTFLGAIALTILPELLRDLMQYRMLIYGALMVLMMLIKPEGIMGNVNFEHIRRKELEHVASTIKNS